MVLHVLVCIAWHLRDFVRHAHSIDVSQVEMLGTAVRGRIIHRNRAILQIYNDTVLCFSRLCPFTKCTRIPQALFREVCDLLREWAWTLLPCSDMGLYHVWTWIGSCRRPVRL